MIDVIKVTYEYELIEKFYGRKKAKRSNVPYMNHIDEGILIISELRNIIGNVRKFGLAARAFCIHPMVQGDNDLRESLRSENLMACDGDSLLLAMEYRAVANAYLSKRKITDLSEIILSPIEEVNVMLAADKIQNRKDFELYHKGKHERSDELDQYFKNWLAKLGVSEGWYQEMKAKLLEHNGLHIK